MRPEAEASAGSSPRKPRRFDPGAFVAGWPGKLGFALDTERRAARSKGPSASLDLKNLTGTLRGRALAGQAALTLNPQKVVAGNLNLQLRQERRAPERPRRPVRSNLDTEFDIASLEDWVPKTTGRVNGKFHITGAWPKLAIEGGAQGRDIAFGEYSVRTVDVKADVRNPQSPSGSLEVKAARSSPRASTFSDVNLDASGDEKDHTAHAQSDRPAAEHGAMQSARRARRRDGWAGTVDQLTLAAVGISPLSLREPAKVTCQPRGFSVSRKLPRRRRRSPPASRPTQDESRRAQREVHASSICRSA